MFDVTARLCRALPCSLLTSSERDLTQEELADRAGLHPNYIGRIERGESNLGVKALFKLARGLGVSPAALFER